MAKKILNFIGYLLFLNRPSIKNSAPDTYTYAGDDVFEKILETNSNLLNIDAQIYARLPYKNGQVKKSIWSFKYNNDQQALRQCSKLLLDELISQRTARVRGFHTSIRAYIMYIPSSRHRNNSKKFDQMNEISRMMKKDTSFNNFFELLTDFFVQPDQAQKQSGFKFKAERLAYAKTRLYISKRYEQTKLNLHLPVYIIDDITTTGATFHRAMRLCRHYGFTNVWCIALCH